jgi:hypothetical protein
MCVPTAGEPLPNRDDESRAARVDPVVSPWSGFERVAPSGEAQNRYVIGATVVGQVEEK